MTAVIVIILVLLILAFIAGGFLFWFSFIRKEKARTGCLPKSPEILKVIEATKEQVRKSKALLEGLPHEDLYITSHDGLKLHAVYYPAARKTEKTVLGVHGYTGSSTGDYGLYASFYRDAGFNLLLVDNRAHGESEGKYIGFGWLDKDDVRLWIDELIKRDPKCTILLAGVSMGAATVLMAGGTDNLPSNVKGIVADCAYTSLRDELNFQMKQMFHLPAFPLMPISGIYLRLLAHYKIDDANTVKQVEKIKIPVLFIHGEEDNYVPFEMLAELFAACNVPKRMLTVPGAVHAMSLHTSPEEYERAVLDFCSTLPL